MPTIIYDALLQPFLCHGSLVGKLQARRYVEASGPGVPASHLGT